MKRSRPPSTNFSSAVRAAKFAAAMELAKEVLEYNPKSGSMTWKRGVGSRAEKGGDAGVVNSIGYLVIGVAGFHLLAHRIAWYITYGNVPAVIDHANGNKTDNAIENLRAATKSLNGANRGKQKNNTSGFKGVVRHKHRWRAQIQVAGRNRHLGVFDTANEASAAYQAEAIKAFGEYARA